MFISMTELPLLYRLLYILLCAVCRGEISVHLLLLVHAHIHMLIFSQNIRVKGWKENINRKTTSWQLPLVSPVFPPEFEILWWLLICPTWVSSQWGCFPFPFYFHLIQSKQLAKNESSQTAVNGPSAFRCLEQEEEGMLFWRYEWKMVLKPDAYVDQKSMSRSKLFKTIWLQYVQEINFGMPISVF